MFGYLDTTGANLQCQSDIASQHQRIRAEVSWIVTLVKCSLNPRKRARKIPAYFTINTWLRNEMHRDLLGIGIDLVKSGFTTYARVLSCCIIYSLTREKPSTTLGNGCLHFTFFSPLDFPSLDKAP